MKFLKSGLPRPIKQEIAQMVKSSETTTATAYLVFVKFENKNTIYSLYYIEESNPALFFIDNRLNITYVYYFNRDVWVIGQTGQQYTGDIEFDEIDSIVYSGSYSRRISQNNNFVFGCYLTSPKKIKLDLAEKYSELDFVVIPKLQNKIVRKNGSYKADENYAGINYITVEVPDSETVKLENLEITPTKEKQTFYPTTEYDGFNNVIVNAIPDSLIEPNYQTKTVTPNKNLQKVTYDSSEGYNALSEVFVEAVPTQTTPTFTENGTYYPQENLFFDKVKVNVFQLDTSDATATENEIFKDKSAYIDGKKVTGSFTIDEELSEQNVLLEDIEELLKSKLAQSQVEGTIEITENGTHNVKNYEFADVNVQPPLQNKTVSPTAEEDGLLVLPDDEYYGLKQVNVTPIKTEQKTITENGLYTPTNGFFFNLVNVEVDDMPKLTTQTVAIADLDAGVYLWDYNGEKTLDYISGTKQIYKNPTLLQISSNGDTQKDFYLFDNEFGADDNNSEIIWGSVESSMSEGWCWKRGLKDIPTNYDGTLEFNSDDQIFFNSGKIGLFASQSASSNIEISAGENDDTYFYISPTGLDVTANNGNINFHASCYDEESNGKGGVSFYANDSISFHAEFGDIVFESSSFFEGNTTFENDVNFDSDATFNNGLTLNGSLTLASNGQISDYEESLDIYKGSGRMWIGTENGGCIEITDEYFSIESFTALNFVSENITFSTAPKISESKVATEDFVTEKINEILGEIENGSY